MTAPKPGDIFQPGDLLNNTYRIEAILGRGGTSEVYRARSEISGRVMAVKALRSEYAINEDFLALMTREEDIRDIRHDAIVRYFDTQRMPDGTVYLVMDHIDGPGLDEKLRTGGMSASELMVVGQRVCEGLIAAHTRNIVHRDLSPDNIILRDDNPQDAVIIDFGIAKDTNPGAETIVGNEFAGKYAYAAPEQLSGKTDPRSDIYSLGALLLSTFRGEKPNIGNNPMEVVEKKGQPLDLTGVPAPLSTLIAKMTDPAPEARFQSATELLEAFKNPDTITATQEQAEPLDDATVIAPLAKASAQKKPASKPSKKPTATKTSTAEAAPTGSKRSPLLPILGVVAVAVIGAGVFFSGALDRTPPLPVADPFTMIIERTENGALTATGFVPSIEAQTALTAALGPMGAQTEFTLATGDVPEGWSDGIIDILRTASPLDEFSIDVTGDSVLVVGLAGSLREQNTVSAAFDAGLPPVFTGLADIALGPRYLMPETIEPFLEAFADCGPLRLSNAPPLGYGLTDQIVVTGRFATQTQRDMLATELAVLGGDRPIQMLTDPLNPALCRIDAALPFARDGGFDVRLGWGDRDGTNTSGEYTVGENPTIDVRLPDSITTGFLRVSIVDVKGVVYHLLPNLSRSDNSIATLRGEAGPDGYVRMAYSVAEGTARGRLAFLVDDSTLGKTKIVVLYSDQKPFADLRPLTESVASYAEAIEDARANGSLRVLSMDTGILTTLASD